MGFSLRIGSMLVTADTAAEAADLVRALGEVMPEPVKRPQGTGGVIETIAGYQIRLRTGPGKRVHRGGFKTRDEAEAALTTLVDTGVAPPLKRHRRPKTPANDQFVDAPAEESAHAPIWPEWPGGAPTMGEGRDEPPLAVEIPAPVVPAPAASETTRKGSPEYRAKVAAAVRASWARRRAARAEALSCDSLPPAVVTAKPPPRCVRCLHVGHVDADCPTATLGDLTDLLPAASYSSEQADDSTDLTDLVDVPDAEPTAIPDVNLGVECHGCGQRGHIMSSPECPLTTKPGWLPDAVRASAVPRTRMPPSFTETPLTMRRHLHVIDLGAEPVDEQRPRTRGECQDEQRPCPWSGCRHHLALDVLETGNLHRTFGEMDLAEMPETCALDVADRDGATLEEIGRALNVSRERIRQIETLAINAAKKSAKRLGLRFEAPDEKRSNAPEDIL